VTAQGWLQIAIYLAILTLLTPVLGAYMARVYRGEVAFLAPLERLARVESAPGQDWKAYARSALAFSVVSWIALYAILRTQGIHPFNPDGFDSGPWDLSFNTASSFVSNTNWQYYGGETTLSYFSQMAGLTVQNFASAAVGMSVLAAVIRGFAARSASSLGNFWQDFTRTLLYILLPLSFAGALILISQGVIQSLAEGPVASQVAIKQLGTNGGGFFNVNSAFPFENATAFSNFVEMLFILLIPAALTATFGRMVGNRRQGWALYVAMAAMLLATIAVAYAAESNESPALQAAGIEQGGNLEGKEQRNGIVNSAAWAAITTAASNGSVNSAHDSFTGAGGTVSLVNMMTGEVIFGGVGSGLYGMLLMVLLAVFIAGLMVGRTPEYLGKKVEAREIKFTLIGVLYPSLGVLVFTALAIATKWGAPSIYNSGPQGFSETLYAYTSQGNNNGSAFAGYTGFVQPNAPGNVGAFGITFADIMGGLAMLAARFVPLAAALAVAGSLAAKRVSPAGPGTFRTDTPTFVFLLVFVIVIVAALTFFPALLLGPVVQALTTQLF
jgi:potassium-transporting ATPase potassium-binding subunit